MMVELWTLIGPYWRLPVRVVWQDVNFAEVRVGAGARLTQRMTKEADEFLARHGTHKGSVHWVSRADLEKVAQPFPGDDPDDAVEWAPVRAKEKLPPGDFQASDFIEEYCKSEYAWINDPIFADAAWSSFCTFMLHWLLNRHKTVDLMFAKLDAFCLRRNWAGTVAKFEWEKVRKNKDRPGRYLSPDIQDMVKRGVAHYLVSRNVTAFDKKNRRMSYTLECQTTDFWEKTVQKVENAKGSFRAMGYMRSITSQMRRQLLKVLGAYSHFLREAARPVAGVPERNIDICDRKSKEHKIATRSGHRPGAPWMPHAVVPVSESAAGEVESADAGMSPVPDLQPEDENVRDTGAESVPGS